MVDTTIAQFVSAAWLCLRPIDKGIFCYLDDVGVCLEEGWPREITVKFRYRSIDFHVDSVPLAGADPALSEGREESNKQKTNLLLGSRLISLWANEPKRNPYINPGFSSLALTIINRIILQGAAGVLPSR